MYYLFSRSIGAPNGEKWSASAVYGNEPTYFKDRNQRQCDNARLCKNFKTI